MKSGFWLGVTAKEKLLWLASASSWSESLELITPAVTCLGEVTKVAYATSLQACSM